MLVRPQTTIPRPCHIVPSTACSGSRIFCQRGNLLAFLQNCLSVNLQNHVDDPQTQRRPMVVVVVCVREGVLVPSENVPKSQPTTTSDGLLIGSQTSTLCLAVLGVLTYGILFQSLCVCMYTPILSTSVFLTVYHYQHYRCRSDKRLKNHHRYLYC